MLIRESARTMKGDYIMKKSVKRLMSAFMALAMVLSLGMSLGGVTASATEIEEVEEVSVDEVSVEPRASQVVYQKNNWKFTSERYSNSFEEDPKVGRFYARAGQTINFVLSNVSCPTNNGFDIYLYRAGSDGTPWADGVRGPYHVNSSNMSGYTFTIQAEYTGYHLIKVKRNNDGQYQTFGSVTIMVG